MTTDAFRSHAAPTQAEINVTPLIDVLLALVVILMVTAPLAMKRLPLPLGNDRDTSSTPRTLALSVLSTGELYLEGRAVSRAELASALGLEAQMPKPARARDPLRCRYAVREGRGGACGRTQQRHRRHPGRRHAREVTTSAAAAISRKRKDAASAGP